MKCMVITGQMYSHYKSNYIQFLTLGGSHDCLYKPSKFPFLADHMTCLPKQPTSLQISLFVDHIICLYNISKISFFGKSHDLLTYASTPLQFSFLVGHMTCLHNPSKFPFLEIPSQTFFCSRLHKPSKFPFLVFPYMVSHMIITTHPVPPYPRFLPNREILLNQVTGSSPLTKWLIIQENNFGPFGGLNKPGEKSF